MNIEDGKCGAWFRDRFQCVKPRGHSRTRHEALLGSGRIRWGRAEGTGQPTNQTATGSPSGGPEPLEGT